MSPEDLGEILQGLSLGQDDPAVLVDMSGSDDAGVYRIAEDRALVLTVDVITPVVDDPRVYGAVACANALSDVYPMGGRPLAGLNIAAFVPGLPAAIYREILQGAAAVARQGGCALIGGHTIKGKEITYGVAVVGEVHPDRILTNAGARDGDVLLLSKALGTSAVATALKNDALDEDDPRYEAMVASMTRLNRTAAETALAHGAHALTDVTGFGLSGHALEMAQASGVTLEIDFPDLPQLPGALELLEAGYTCGGGEANRRRAHRDLEVEGTLDRAGDFLLHDPQTSGGLLMALPAHKADDALAALHAAGDAAAARIGRVLARGATPLRVRTS